MTSYDAVLFDNDGILVDPPARDTQTRATLDAFRAVGVDDPDPDHVAALVDGVTVDHLEAICRAYDLDPEPFWAAREDHDERSQFAAFERGDRDRYDDVDVVPDLPGAAGVVSNNHHSTVEWILSRFGMDGWFDVAIGREKTVASIDLKKPDPHNVERALADLGATTALYVGDSDGDVVAAERAGIDSAFVRRSHCRDGSLSTEPTYDLDGLAELRRIVD